MSVGALSHLRVIDLTHYIAGPYCTKLMAGFGAEVIKIERPEIGDKLRSMGPFYKGKPGIERSDGTVSCGRLKSALHSER